jgi:inosine/xanthosine triphosphatase
MAKEDVSEHMNKVIAVGSANKQKIEGSRLAAARVFPDFEIEMLSRRVDSGVSNQPMNLRDMHLGARNRSMGIMQAFPEADFGIGIESGFNQFNGRWLDSSIVSVVNRDGKEALGETIKFEVGSKIMSLVFQGQELSDAVAEVTGINTRETRDCYGALTNGAVTCLETFRDGIAAALSHFAFSNYHELGEGPLTIR